MEDEGKIGPFGFIRDQIETNEDGAPVIASPKMHQQGTVAIYDDQSKQWGAYEL